MIYIDPSRFFKNLIQIPILVIDENKKTKCNLTFKISKIPMFKKKFVFDIRPPNKAPIKIKIPR